MSRRTIHLESGHGDIKDRENHRRWKVTKVTNSIEYTPDDYLTEETVKRLCEMSTWDVTITSYKAARR